MLWAIFLILTIIPIKTNYSKKYSADYSNNWSYVLDASFASGINMGEMRPAMPAIRHTKGFRSKGSDAARRCFVAHQGTQKPVSFLLVFIN